MHPLDKEVLYFAYGSNMYQLRLENRVGKVKCLGTHVLNDYQLTFDVGTKTECFANVMPSKGKTCEGVIYEMRYGQLLQLDWYEGLYVRVKEQYKGRKLHLYISEWRNKNKPEISSSYKAALILGCVTHKLTHTLEIVESIPVIEQPINFEYYIHD